MGLEVLLPDPWDFPNESKLPHESLNESEPDFFPTTRGVSLKFDPTLPQPNRDL
jgi:hypothetical protein